MPERVQLRELLQTLSIVKAILRVVAIWACLQYVRFIGRYS